METQKKIITPRQEIEQWVYKANNNFEIKRYGYLVVKRKAYLIYKKFFWIMVTLMGMGIGSLILNKFLGGGI
jgi:hypothetical protein